MANFPGLILTDAGRNLQAKAQIGQTLQFTRVALGQGYAPPEPESLTALVDEQQSLSIQSFEVIGDGTSKIRAILTNEGLASGFFVREIGVFARDPDTLEETLYSYSNSDAQSDYLPAEGGATVVEQIFDLVTVIGNAQDVTAVIDDYITIATKADIEEIRPYILPEAGQVGQLLRKATNAEGDTEWFDPAEGINVRVHSITERRVAVADQDVFNLADTRTAGLAVYVEGVRLDPTEWQALNATQVQLDQPQPAGTVVQFVNNEEVGVDELARVSLVGPDLVYPDSTNTYTITDFDAFSTYTVATTVGTASRTADTVTLTIPLDAEEGSLTLTITRNDGSTSFVVAVGAQTVAAPEVLSPTNGATGVMDAPTLTTSAFATYPSGSDTHASTDWQISTASDFSTILWESLADTANLESIAVPSGTLSTSTTYYVRARHQGTSLGSSAWSAVVTFTTTDVFYAEGAILSDGSSVGGQLNGNWIIFAPDDESTDLDWSAAKGAAANKTTGGHTDWLLPAKDELNLLWLNRNQIPGGLAGIGIDTAGNRYWTSTTNNLDYQGEPGDSTTRAWTQRFDDGYQYWFNNLSGEYRVRCARKIPV
ncbi:DUF1566 domain-containing protein [Halomonas alkaliantarctica]|nr:DUF1566 domain-containing protein [Halomonas alkaliantarctica]